MIDQTWQYNFCNAYRVARSDRMFGKDKRNPRQRGKTDRIFFQKPEWCAGYEAGMNSSLEGVASPMTLFNEWIKIYEATAGH